ncbi:hypothetical protein DI392_17955 [Vibrio albus]|uniref:Uncharacterized protein n=1 Tax=Vibrio albus TaxID=2200953 RepID=A0A2U3B548_9VIBR|nr:hypothetical protein [Vibrio albus]PWI31916.1 hypothetical protein DI392_17955 [Vibrio albus]
MAGIQDLHIFASQGIGGLFSDIHWVPSVPDIGSVVNIRFSGSNVTASIDGGPLFQPGRQDYPLELSENRDYIVYLYNNQGRMVAEKKISPLVLIPEVFIDAPAEIVFEQDELLVRLQCKNSCAQTLMYKTAGGEYTELQPTAPNLYRIPVEEWTSQVDILTKVSSVHAEYTQEAIQQSHTTVNVRPLIPSIHLGLPDEVTFSSREFDVTLSAENAAEVTLLYRVEGEEFREAQHLVGNSYRIPVSRYSEHRIEVVASAVSQHVLYTEEAACRSEVIINVMTPEPLVEIQNTDFMVFDASAVAEVNIQWASDVRIQNEQTGEWLYEGNNEPLYELLTIRLPAYSELCSEVMWSIYYTDLSGMRKVRKADIRFHSRVPRAWVNFEQEASRLVIRTEGLRNILLSFPQRGLYTHITDSSIVLPVKYRSIPLKGELTALDDNEQPFKLPVSIPARELRRYRGR